MFNYGYYWFFIGIAIFGILRLIFLSMKFELVIADGKVTGKTLFEKRVDFPISQISASGMVAFNRVSIATSSGSINFYGVSNAEEIFKCISNLLMKRQEETKVNSSIESQNVADEIKKMKELLDMGIITQEKFEAKKKQ